MRNVQLTRLDLIQQRDIPFLPRDIIRRNMSRDVEVLHVRYLSLERGKLVEVCRE